MLLKAIVNTNVALSVQECSMHSFAVGNILLKIGSPKDEGTMQFNTRKP